MAKERPQDSFGFQYAFCEDWLFNNYKVFCRQKICIFLRTKPKSNGSIVGSALGLLASKMHASLAKSHTTTAIAKICLFFIMKCCFSRSAYPPK